VPLGGTAQPGSAAARLPRRHTYQRVVTMTMASKVPIAIAKNPLAIHCAASSANAVLDEAADRS
jgi:hypothetical protein